MSVDQCILDALNKIKMSKIHHYLLEEVVEKEYVDHVQ